MHKMMLIVVGLSLAAPATLTSWASDEIVDEITEGYGDKAIKQEWKIVRRSGDHNLIVYFTFEFLGKGCPEQMEQEAASKLATAKAPSMDELYQAQRKVREWGRWYNKILDEYAVNGRQGSILILPEEIPGVLSNFSKYAEWHEVSARAELAPGVEKALPNVGGIGFTFITPDRLFVKRGEDWGSLKMTPEDVSRISKLLNRVGEFDKMDADREQKEKLLQEENERKQREEEAKKAQRLKDEEKARSLLQ